MRTGKLILWDIKCQVKYGFLLLYVILTALYLVVLSVMPQSWRETAAAIIVYSDPAAMGLFFMGAIVLLEKSQRIPCAFATSPVRASEYLVAKIVSLGAVMLLVAAVLAIAAKVISLPFTMIGTFLSGVTFTLLGIIIATKIKSLNQFILVTVPVEMLVSVPAVLHLFGVLPAFLRFYPACVCIDMIAGNKVSAMGFIPVIALIAVLFIVALKCVKKMWLGAGGGEKL